jgi:hypothetical protein
MNKAFTLIHIARKRFFRLRKQAQDNKRKNAQTNFGVQFCHGPWLWRIQDMPRLRILTLLTV